MPFIIDMQPVGRRATVETGDSLLAAAQTAGVELAAICGGIGACDSCRIRLIKGELTPPTLVEENVFSREELHTGWRLACQCKALSHVTIDIPPESLTAPQRLQIEGDSKPVALDPVVTTLDVQLPPPTLTDLRSDVTRLNDSVGLSLSMDLSVLTRLSDQLRAQHWSVRLAIRQPSTLVGVLPTGSQLLGFAADIGTTSIAAYLVDLELGTVLAKTGTMNPQIAYGEDVISRILYINDHPQHSTLLQQRLISTLNDLASALCEQVNVSINQIVEAVLVGNTVMHHITAGLPTKQLGEAPYLPSTSRALEFPASAIGLHFAPGAMVYMPPIVAGYVGADHVAALVAAEIWQASETTLLIDIGTNTEVTLAVNGQFYSCSCASGPAFEGAHIHDGMRAAPGAIERVQVIDGQIHIQTIGVQTPVGICGSGILDAVAVMLETGNINSRGAFKTRSSGFVLSEQDGRQILVTRQDVGEIQLAKSAIRTGIELLLDRAGIRAEAIERFIIAGAFGTYINVGSAVQIGMFPNLPRERFIQVGNAAGVGAWHLLVSNQLRQEADRIASEVHYLELTTHPHFQDTFVDYMALE